MTLSNFLSKLNWRLILIHFVATWFIFHALWEFGFLYDYNYLEAISSRINEHNYRDFNNYRGLDGERISKILYYAILTKLGGVLGGFIISLLLSFKHKWLWVNSLIVLLMTFILFCLDRFYYDHIRFITQAPGKIFKSDWAHLITNGLIMLAIGLLLFFNKRLIRFINGNVPDHVNP